MQTWCLRGSVLRSTLHQGYCNAEYRRTPRAIDLDLEVLGFEGDTLERLQELFAPPNGILLATMSRAAVRPPRPAQRCEPYTPDRKLLIVEVSDEHILPSISCTADLRTGTAETSHGLLWHHAVSCRPEFNLISALGGAVSVGDMTGYVERYCHEVA